MNVKGMIKSNKGFSLVELMVVVAIIGILAAIAVPNVNRYMLKSRQGEAKTNLGSLYTSEKSFFTEHTKYVTDLGAIGFSPEGQARYNVGFNAAGTTDASGDLSNTGATGDGTFAIWQSATTGRCFSAGSTCTIYQNTVPLLGAAYVINNGATPRAFLGGAAAPFLNYGGAGQDEWSINHLKVISQVSSGL